MSVILGVRLQVIRFAGGSADGGGGGGGGGASAVVAGALLSVGGFSTVVTESPGITAAASVSVPFSSFSACGCTSNWERELGGVEGKEWWGL